MNRNPGMRNNKLRRPIDSRWLMVGRTHEDATGFTVIRMIKPQHIETGIFEITMPPISNSLGEKPRKFWIRLADALSSRPGTIRGVHVMGLDDEEIAFENLGEGKFNIHMNGFLNIMDAAQFDQIVMRFAIEDGKVIGVHLDLIDAFDKQLNRELDEFFESLDPIGEFDWLKVEFLLDASLRASQLLAEADIEMSTATITFGPPDCRERFFYVQWEWLDEDEVSIEIVGPKHAIPKLSQEQIKKLLGMGWNLTTESGNPNFHRRFRETPTRDIAKCFIQAIRQCFDIAPNDPIFIEPNDVMEAILPSKNMAERQKKLLETGIVASRDVQVTEKWLREK